MTSTASLVTLSPQDYGAVLFDLDGVLTKTASVHTAAWERRFDGYLCGRAKLMKHSFENLFVHKSTTFGFP